MNDRSDRNVTASLLSQCMHWDARMYTFKHVHDNYRLNVDRIKR